MSTESTEALIERVLAEHDERFDGMWTACSCGDWSTTSEESPHGSAAPHRAHVAAAITQALAERSTANQPRRLCEPVDTTWAEDAAASRRALYDTDSGRRDNWSER